MTARIFVAAAALILGMSAPAHAEPTREVTASRGFDLLTADVVVSEEVDAATLDPSCVGKISAQPNYIVTADGTAPLLIGARTPASVAEQQDYTLVVRAPDGSFLCDDDGGGSLDPEILIARPEPGRYEIWVGVYGEWTLGNEPRRVPSEITIVETDTTGAAGGAPEPASVTPPFPRWPPPRASARTEIQRALFVGDNNLGQVADRLLTALRNSGNSRASFYTAPGGGFVLVAQLEGIRNDARPVSGDRRFIEPRPGQPIKPDDPLDFIEALFFAPEGNYRQVMFVVSDLPVVEGNWALTTDEAGVILAAGSARLGGGYRARAFSPNHRITALIYEFRKEGEAQAEITLPGRWNATTHLTRSGLLSSLQR